MADQWEVVEFPAIMPVDKPLWPEFWEKTRYCRLRRPCLWESGMRSGSSSLRLLRSAIIKREWWKDWDQEKIPGDSTFAGI